MDLISCLRMTIGLDPDDGTEAFGTNHDLKVMTTTETAVEAEAVNLKRFDQDLASTLHSIMETSGDPGGGNVVLLLDNAVKLSTHLCFLSSSPVLKKLYMDIEVRLEKTSYISMPGFSERAVKQLLQFLHRGFVVFDFSESQQEFLYLCTSLKINPPVIKDFNLKNVGAKQVGSEAEAKERAEDKNYDEETPSSSDSIVPHAEVISSDDNISSETLGLEFGNLIRNEGEASLANDCDPENNYLENLQSPPARSLEDVSSDDETPEHISDFLNQMMPVESQNEESKNDSSESYATTEQETEVSQNTLLSNPDCFESHPPLDTFKMPDSFDIPTDYIQEILPNKTLSTSVKNEASPIKNLGNLSSHNEVKSPDHKNLSQKEKLNLDDILSEAMLDNDNTPVQDDLTQVQLTTYRKDSSAKRNRGIQGKINPKRDRKKIMAELFNDSDSSDSEAGDKSNNEREKQKIVDDLEEKKNRMKIKLKNSVENISKKSSNSVRDDVRKILNSTPSSSSSKKKNEEDDKFIVPDNEVSISDHSSTESEEDPSSQDSGEDLRGKRLGDRKKKKGGDVLAWMNRKASVKVIVQNSPKFNIMERGQYRLKLLADESKDSESEHEPSSSVNVDKKALESDSSSDDSIPRGRRIRGLKSSSDSETEARKRKKKKKLKKKSKLSREERKESFPVPVEEVVWTPDMYRKWDSMSTKRKSGESDSYKSKQKQIKRSHSIDLKRSSTMSSKVSDKNKFNRSVSTLESSSSQGTPTKITSPLPWPNATTLPKIPKLKKI